MRKHLLGWTIRLYLVVLAALTLLTHGPVGGRRRSDRDERGDVPGWVLVTVMTAGLVGAIWLIAEPQLKSMLRSALNSVRD